MALEPAKDRRGNIRLRILIGAVVALVGVTAIIAGARP